jgi:hypothetical protein
MIEIRASFILFGVFAKYSEKKRELSEKKCSGSKRVNQQYSMMDVHK